MPSSLQQALIAESDAARIAELRQLLAKNGGAPARPGIHRIKLTEGLYRLLIRIVEELADGKAVSLAFASQALTTQEAARFLGVSRQFLVRLLDQGEIAFHRVGTHRRVYLRDLISFRTQRDRRRHDAIQKMAREAVKDGVYDDF